MKIMVGVMFCMFAIGMISCKSTDSTTDESLKKLDAMSKRELVLAEESAPEGVLSLVMLLNRNYDEALGEELKKINVKVISKAGRIITAEAGAKSTRDLLKLPQVTSIEINKTKSIK